MTESITRKEFLKLTGLSIIAAGCTPFIDEEITPRPIETLKPSLTETKHATEIVETPTNTPTPTEIIASSEILPIDIPYLEVEIYETNAVSEDVSESIPEEHKKRWRSYFDRQQTTPMSADEEFRITSLRRGSSAIFLDEEVFDTCVYYNGSTNQYLLTNLGFLPEDISYNGKVLSKLEGDKKIDKKDSWNSYFITDLENNTLTVIRDLAEVDADGWYAKSEAQLTDDGKLLFLSFYNEYDISKRGTYKISLDDLTVQELPIDNTPQNIGGTTPNIDLNQSANEHLLLNEDGSLVYSPYVENDTESGKYYRLGGEFLNTITMEKKRIRFPKIHLMDRGLEPLMHRSETWPPKVVASPNLEFIAYREIADADAYGPLGSQRLVFDYGIIVYTPSGIFEIKRGNLAPGTIDNNGRMIAYDNHYGFKKPENGYGSYGHWLYGEFVLDYSTDGFEPINGGEGRSFEINRIDNPNE